MSIANLMPQSRPGLSPMIRADGEDDMDDDLDQSHPSRFEPQKRSPLADILYLRCKLVPVLSDSKTLMQI